MADGPRVFLLVRARLRVLQDVVDLVAILGGGHQVVAVEVADGVDAEAGVPAPELLVVMGDGDAVGADYRHARC